MHRVDGPPLPLAGLLNRQEKLRLLHCFYLFPRFLLPLQLHNLNCLHCGLQQKTDVRGEVQSSRLRGKHAQVPPDLPPDRVLAIGQLLLGVAVRVPLQASLRRQNHP